MLSKAKIVLTIRTIGDQPEQIETREQRGRKLDVLSDGFSVIVTTVGGIGSSQDGDASVEGGHDTGLGNGHCLLFHHFVNSSSILG